MVHHEPDRLGAQERHTDTEPAGPGYMLAILFEEDLETGARSVSDIIRVEGVDRNARRRLRRAIVRRHGLIDRWGYCAVTYETWWPVGKIDAQDVTRRFLAKPKRSKAATPASQSPGKPSSLPLDREPLT